MLVLRDLRRGQACEQILQIIEWIETVPPTTAQQGVDHRAAFPSLRMSNKQPVFLSKGTRPNGILDQVVVNLQTPVVHKPRQRLPAFQSVINGLAEQTLRQRAS